MSNIIEFPVVKNNTNSEIPTYNLFDKLTNRLGVDMNKIVFDKDTDEQAKLRRLLLKESMRVRSDVIRTD